MTGLTGVASGRPLRAHAHRHVRRPQAGAAPGRRSRSGRHDRGGRHRARRVDRTGPTWSNGPMWPSWLPADRAGHPQVARPRHGSSGARPGCLGAPSLAAAAAQRSGAGYVRLSMPGRWTRRRRPGRGGGRPARRHPTGRRGPRRVSSGSGASGSDPGSAPTTVAAGAGPDGGRRRRAARSWSTATASAPWAETRRAVDRRRPAAGDRRGPHPARRRVRGPRPGPRPVRTASSRCARPRRPPARSCCSRVRPPSSPTPTAGSWPRTWATTAWPRPGAATS